MTAPFAALEARLNSAVVAHLANATADFGGGVVVDGEFAAPYSEAFGIVSGSRPAFTAPLVGLPAVTQGAALAIGGVSYTVAELHPDGTGNVSLLLEKA